MPLQIDENALDDVADKDKERVLEKIEWLWANRSVITHHPLKENLVGMCKKRFGKYRIIYAYEENPDQMVIRIVGTRDDIYKDAAKG